MTFLVRGIHCGSVHIVVRVDNRECGNLKVPMRAFREMANTFAKNPRVSFVFV